MRHFATLPDLQVAAVLTNRKQAGVWQRAEAEGVPVHYLDKTAVEDGAAHLALLEPLKPVGIALAGYLRKMPDAVVERYAGRILNVHPSLLPRHGGPGMYGLHVHQAVLDAGDTESGISIHRVTPIYDEGEVVLQARTPVPQGCTTERLQSHLLALEHRLFPLALEWLCRDQL